LQNLSVVGAVVVTALVHAAFFAIYVLAYNGDVTALVCADMTKIGTWPYEDIRVGFSKGGYDGQYCYSLARAPLCHFGQDVIDFPAYRQVRVLYPAMAWLCSGGNPQWLVWALPIINFAAILALAWCGALLAACCQRSPWWGCLLPIVLNAGMPALRDLTDPLAMAAVFAMICAYLVEWPVCLLGLFGAAAVFGREQNVIVLLLVLGDSLLRKRWLASAAMGAALVAWVSWVAVLHVMYGAWPFSGGNLSLPFGGIGFCLTHLTGSNGRLAIVNDIGMALIFLQMAICGALLIRRARRLTAAVAAAGLALAIVGGIPIYESAWSYSRVFAWMPLGIWLWSMQSGRRWPVAALAPTGLLTLMACLQPWLQ
jgi:hypothetical protein